MWSVMLQIVLFLILINKIDVIFQWIVFAARLQTEMIASNTENWAT